MVDTAAASNAAGMTDLSGALPRDVLGDPTQEAQQPSVAQTGTDSIDKFYADQAAQQQATQEQAAQLASLQPAGTTITTAGLPSTSSGIGSKIISAAEHYLGTDYSWGKIDCSGLVQLAYKAAGIDLPRISFQQANSGKKVGLNALRPGDLVAWDNSTRNNGADHIAIWLGGGKILEAAAPGTKVRIRSLGSNEGAWGVQMGWS